MERAEDLFHVLGEEETLTVGRHILERKSISRFMPDEYFPIENEDQLLHRSYVAMMACREERIAGASKRQAPGDASPILTWLDETTVSK